LWFTFVWHRLIDFNAAGSANNQLGPAVVDTLLDLEGSKSSKDDLKRVTMKEVDAYG
jgi:hypothetical protein